MMPTDPKCVLRDGFAGGCHSLGQQPILVGI